MTSVPTEDEVLDAFAVEPDHDEATIRRYLLAYPQYAEALVDLSRELMREMPADGPLTDGETAWIDEAVKRYAGARPVARFSPPTVEQRRAAAGALRVPRQVVAAILECRVVVDTIATRTLRTLAAQFDATLEDMVAAISGPPTLASRSYKSDGQPSVGGKVPFERVLRDAGVADDVVAELVAKED